ncbi:hypothetical protein JCM11251_005238 [Rhodosporidiobolus azoricus]
MSGPRLDGLPLHTSDEGLAPDLAQEVGRHISAIKTQRHLGIKKAGGAAMGVLNGGRVQKHLEEEDEVDDDWFGVKAVDPAEGIVRIGMKVPRRAGTMIKRTIRGGRHHLRGKSGRKIPAIVVEEDADAERFELEEDEGGAPFGTEHSVSTFTDGPLQASPTESMDSLLTIDLPFSLPSGPGVPSSSSSSQLQLPYGRSSGAPPFATLSTLPTLSELRSFDSTSSSSPSVSANSRSGGDTPTRMLSIDDGPPMPGVKRTTSRSTFRSGGHRHRLHLPGRPKFSMRKKTTPDMENAGATPAAGLTDDLTKALLEAGVVQLEEEKVEVDVLYEHQRGLVVFGIPRFSSAALLQIDPSEWCDSSLRPSPFNPHDHPCPPYWLWRDSEFMVCMSGDVDEEGWSYASRFRSRHWSGEPTFPYAFVRRRQWIRTRIYRPEPVLPPGHHLLSSASSAVGAASKADVTDDFRDEIEQEEGGETEKGHQGKGVEEITDLRSACRCLPLYAERRAAIFAESSAGIGTKRCTLDPLNPFLSFQQLKREAMEASLVRDGDETEKEPVWRDAVIEINYRRAVCVIKAFAGIDRARLELWKRWMGEGKKGKDKGTEGEGDAASVREGSDLEDVWDVVEARLDLILPLFDYNLTRLSFLRLILTLHPSRASSHRHEGYDLPCSTRRAKLEEDLAGTTGVTFYSGVEELVKQYECAEGLEEEKARDKERERVRREKQEEKKRRATMRSMKRKGKERV